MYDDVIKHLRRIHGNERTIYVKTCQVEEEDRK